VRFGKTSHNALILAATWVGNLNDCCFAVRRELSGAPQTLAKSAAFMAVSVDL